MIPAEVAPAGRRRLTRVACNPGCRKPPPREWLEAEHTRRKPQQVPTSLIADNHCSCDRLAQAKPSTRCQQAEKTWRPGAATGLAECNSAIRQIASLRHGLAKRQGAWGAPAGRAPASLWFKSAPGEVSLRVGLAEMGD
jgi:hypothetical protein